MSKQTFIQGTLVLIVAGLITRFLGFINRIVVARIMGEEGVGLYMMALPTLFLVITVTHFGLPVAISKRVAEADAKGDKPKIKKILLVSFTLTLILSTVFTVAFLFISPIVAQYLLTDERTLYPLYAISPIIPIVAMSAVLRGYFQGRQNMKPQAISQVIEQIVRIALVAFLTKMLLPYGVEFAASGAMISVVIGEFCSLMYIIYQFKTNKRIKLRVNIVQSLQKATGTLKELMSIAVPTTGSRLVGNLTHFLEPILVSQSLAIAGYTVTQSTKLYGELTGYVLPLLFLPTFITTSLSTALVPSISEAEAKKQIRLIHFRIHQSIRLSFASGALATIVLFIFAKPILQFMYNDPDASHFVTLMAPFFILLYFQAPLQAALQALDLAKQAMYNSIIGSIVKLATLLILASQPQFGIAGVVLAIIVGVVLVTFLHFSVLVKYIQFRLPLVDILKMISLLLVTYYVGHKLYEFFPQAEEQLISLLIIFVLLTGIYIILLFMFRFITKEELNQLPFFNKEK
ncbi:stage V sporulation protein B [Salinibacillus xinjiangensis]|uniref:Stage V sporulation protein B n=1 Tax=Salinibacillus xinjiangensis TaxID=1229268 RepID=A0A6G1XBE3_9BACI|nr:stage V sporulation protein B [Salinibacillus xinjiangensis]MRG88252.1 stage V sporulation protein B [Salinibacillus xinjiangensis]